MLVGEVLHTHTASSSNGHQGFQCIGILYGIESHKSEYGLQENNWDVGNAGRVTYIDIHGCISSLV